MRFFIVILLCCFLAGLNSFAADETTSDAWTVERFESALRQLPNGSKQERRIELKKLATRALRIAKQDVASNNAEDLLHWILKHAPSSSSATGAARLVVNHHASSDTSVSKFMAYSRRPASWTPGLFQALRDVQLSPKHRFIVDACNAVHQKSLLELADDMKYSGRDLSLYQSQLGASLTKKLHELDRERIEARVAKSFSILRQKYGEQEIGGMTAQELADSSIFAIRHLRLGKTAKGLAGVSPDGQGVDLKQFEGRIVLVDFWATWCAPCIGAIPELKKLRNELDDSRFEIIGVNLDNDAQGLARQIKKLEIDWPNIVSDDEFRHRWHALSLPFYYVLDDKHVVRYRGNNENAAIRVARDLYGPPVKGIAGVDPAKEMFSALDTNSDQRIQPSEIPDHLKAGFEAMDVNKDGVISLTELRKGMKDFKPTKQSVTFPTK